MCQNRITLQFLLLFPVHCITAREQFSQKSCLLWIDQTLLPSSYQCTDFGVSYTSYENGCFSAVNRVRHLGSDNCHLKCHGNSIEFKYGWNFINAHQWLYFWLEQGFPSILPVVFLAGFYPGVSPLGGACPRFAGLLMPNRRQNKWKYRSRFKASNNTSKRKSLKHANVRICSHMGPRNITNMTLFTSGFSLLPLRMVRFQP